MMAPEDAVPDVSERLFDVVQVATAVLDDEGVVIGWTSAAERLVGYPDEAILNRPVASLLEAPDRATAAAVAEQCRMQGGWDGVVGIRHRDGRRLKLAVRVSPLHDPAGNRLWSVLARNDQQTPGSELSQMMFEPLLAHSPIGVAVLDTDLRFLWANDWLEYGGAVPRERRLGRPLAEVFPNPDENVEKVVGAMRQVLDTGVPVLNLEFLGPSPADPTRRHAWWTCGFRLEDPTRRVLGVWYMTMDVTDRWRARERLALLTEASARIGGTLDVERTAQELAEVAVPRFADVVTVDLLEGVLRGEEPPPGPVGSTPALRRAGQQSVHEGRPEATARVGDLLNTRPATPSAHCLIGGKPWVESLADLSVGSWAAEDPARAAEIRAFGIHSVMIAPVQARGARLGIVTFLRSQCPDPFDQDDVSLAEELVARAAVCRQRPPLHPRAAGGSGAAAQPAAAWPGRRDSAGRCLALPASGRSQHSGRRLVRRHHAVRSPRCPGSGGCGRTRDECRRLHGPTTHSRPHARRPGPASR
ncbi:PAS domain-containing protein [Streptomyces cynarae]|uniref:PAS domain-containing protein n=1 Tax=Streptomyces cynarae TaxID=2981134 RepID=UPI0028BEEB57|nr:PAS domain-containing protein [Streptomyces cynarae]